MPHGHPLQNYGWQPIVLTYSVQYATNTTKAQFYTKQTQTT